MKSRSSTFTCVALFLIALAYVGFKLITDWSHWLFVPIEYFGPFGFLLGLLFFSAALLRRRYFCVLLSTLSVLVWFPSVSGVYALNSSTSSTSTNGAISVLSYNVWSFRKDGNDLQAKKSIADKILAFDADIQCLQEYEFPQNLGEWLKPETVRSRLLDSGYNSYVPDTRRASPAILSRFPISKTGEVYMPQFTARANRAIFADLRTPKGELRVYSVHLGSFSKLLLGEKDLKQGKVSRVYESYKAHSAATYSQFHLLFESIHRSPHPVIVCGDFNDPPFGYNYKKMRTFLESSFEEKGFGVGGTSNKDGLRLVRIDHIFMSSELEPVSFTTHNSIELSDHYPVSAKFRFK